ncbi:uncharacterized protein [Mytilus edulis]
MADSQTQHISTALYRYLCQNIVGSEDHVKTVRLMNTIRDNLFCNDQEALITSGSFGEGLDLKNSDLDLMHVIKFVEVYEDIKPRLYTGITYFSMKTDDVKPGFTTLLLEHTDRQSLFDINICDEIDGRHYCSSKLFKQRLFKIFSLFNKIDGSQVSTIHGPCISNTKDIYDRCYCFHCKTWISTAEQWITRSNNSWPGYSVKQMILKHGVIFVPIGVKESSKEDLEWRISFSVGEKLLMNTFTHTQLVCYVLLKILTKDVIAKFSKCEDLLCSYFLKTIIFWISEELPQSVWKAENLIPCFMRCFNRLVYCVEHSVCLHYFIPENNMFENNIEGPAREILLENLYILRSYSWRCILFSDQICQFRVPTINFPIEPNEFHVYDFQKIVNSKLLTLANVMAPDFIFRTGSSLLFKRAVRQIFSCEKSSIKYIVSYYMSICCTPLAEGIKLNTCNSNNKCQYRKYTSCLSLLLQNIYHDAVSGWMMLASYFYKTKQYNNALHVIAYAISKCSPEKLYNNRNMDHNQQQLVNLKLFQRKNITFLLKILLIENMLFLWNSELIPDELKSEACNGIYTYQSPAYPYFLNFLCHYRLNNVKQCHDCLKDLERLKNEYYFYAERYQLSMVCNLFGIALQLSGDTQLAQNVFWESALVHPKRQFNPAIKRFAAMN